jgi:1,4-alpha-glucan branching enzyme
MKAFSTLPAVWVFALLPAVGRTQPPPMAVVSPEVSPGRAITFRLLAPNAKEVIVHGEFAAKSTPMVKDEKGLWSAAVGPIRPDIYGYGFRMDGLNMLDPSNTFVRVGSLA